MEISLRLELQKFLQRRKQL